MNSPNYRVQATPGYARLFVGAQVPGAPGAAFAENTGSCRAGGYGVCI
jgi:hypothetical protein